jgi:2-methylisocitrate lyase-like PEP mutase family enzyme
MEGKQLIPAAEMVEKIRAAVAARSSPDFVIIARTDARAVEGLDAAIDRARRYREAGADLLFVEAPESDRDIERVASALGDVPLLFNWAEGGKTPPMPLPRLRELGFRIVIFPIGALLVAARAIRELMDTLVEHGTPAAAADRMVPFKDFIAFMGLGEVRALEQRFASQTPPAPPAS